MEKIKVTIENNNINEFIQLFSSIDFKIIKDKIIPIFITICNLCYKHQNNEILILMFDILCKRFNMSKIEFQQFISKNILLFKEYDVIKFIYFQYSKFSNISINQIYHSSYSNDECKNILYNIFENIIHKNYWIDNRDFEYENNIDPIEFIMVENFSNLNEFNKKLLIELYRIEEYKNKMGLIFKDPIKKYITNDILLTKLYGPTNLTSTSINEFNKDFDCVKYGCRMLLCNEFNCNDNEINDNEINDNDNDNEIVNDWYLGYCQECNIELEKRHCLRIPKIYGGWIGCYCSIHCIKNNIVKNAHNYNVDEVKILSIKLEFMNNILKKYKIYDSIHLKNPKEGIINSN